jgi:hypothetical protein
MRRDPKFQQSMKKYQCIDTAQSHHCFHGILKQRPFVVSCGSRNAFLELSAGVG